MTVRSMLLRALPVPTLVFATLALLIWQAFEEFADAWVFAIPLVLWVLAVLHGAVTRERQLRPLLREDPAPMSTVDAARFGVYDEGEPGGAGTAEERETLERLLRTHRLVVLVGPRLSGRSRRAYTTLRAGFGSFRMLRPAAARAGATPPLSELLTTSVLRLRGGYVLWLEDLGALMQAGFDPRAVERWLSAGRRRMALARITPTQYHRLRAAQGAEAVALARAIPIHLDSQRGPRRPASPEARYTALLADSSPTAQAIRYTATLELLGVSEPTLTLLEALLTELGHEPLRDDMLSGLQDPDPLLSADPDGVLTAHPAVADLLDPQLRRIEQPLQRALLTTLDSRGLMAVSQALAIRLQHADAARMLAAAREGAGSDPELSLAITRTSIRLVELEEGASGVTLANKGGFDHREMVGWEQLERLRRNQPDDEVFDLGPPEQDLRLSTRLYRLRVYRAGARVVVLALLDCLALFGASVLALCVRAIARGGPVDPFTVELAKLLLPTIAVAIPIAVWVGLYRSDQARAQTQLILAATTLTTFTLPLVYFARKVQVGSFLALLTFFAAMFFLDSALRYAYDLRSRSWVRKRGLLPRVLIMGDRRDARACARSITGRDGRQVTAVGYLSNAQDTEDVCCFGTYEDLERTLVDRGISEVVIADRMLELDAKAHHIAKIQRLGLDVRFAANEREVILGASGRVGDHGLVFVPAALMTPEALELKRMLDWLIVAITLPVWGSVLACYAAYSATVRRGQPVFVTTDRAGLGDTAFAMLRLRTRTCLGGSPVRGAKPTGRVEAAFERLGLDELPQVINVLRGEMSIVGPRPLHAQDVQRMTREQRRTLATRPGITGRWQMDWSEDASNHEMRALDAEYMRRWRVSRDLDLIVRTPFVVARRRLYLGDSEVRQRIRRASLLP